MSELVYVKKPETMEKKKGVPVKKPITTNHGLLFTIVAVVGISLLIGVGFAYMGYTSGHFSSAYVLCKEDILSQVRVGVYQSADEITAVLASCDGIR